METIIVIVICYVLFGLVIQMVQCCYKAINIRMNQTQL